MTTTTIARESKTLEALTSTGTKNEINVSKFAGVSLAFSVSAATCTLYVAATSDPTNCVSIGAPAGGSGYHRWLDDDQLKAVFCAQYLYVEFSTGECTVTLKG